MTQTIQLLEQTVSANKQKLIEMDRRKENAIKALCQIQFEETELRGRTDQLESELKGHWERLNSRKNTDMAGTQDQCSMAKPQVTDNRAALRREQTQMNY